MLNRGEDVRLVTPASTWASPRAILAVTDRRLLWLLDDVPVSRVHALAFRNVEAIEHRVKRKHATLTVRTLGGRKHVFHELATAHCGHDRAPRAGTRRPPASYRGRVREADPVHHVELRQNAHGQDGVVFSFPYRADIVDAVRSIPGRRFDWQAKEWWAPRAEATAPYVQGVLERFPELEVAPDVNEWLAKAVKGWVGRVTAARRAGAGWFVLDAIAGELPEELKPFAEERGDRQWLPFTQEVADALLDLAGARMDQRALRCATKLQVGLEPAPATLMLVESYGESRFKLEVNWDPDTVGGVRRAARGRGARPHAARSIRTCSSRSSTSSACTASTSAPTPARRWRGCASSTTRRSTPSAAAAPRTATRLACEDRARRRAAAVPARRRALRARVAAAVHRRRAGPGQDRSRRWPRSRRTTRSRRSSSARRSLKLNWQRETEHWLPHRSAARRRRHRQGDPEGRHHRPQLRDRPRPPRAAGDLAARRR